MNSVRRSRAAERAGDRGPVADVDAVGDVLAAAVDDALELVRQRHRHPYPALGVEADAVRWPVEAVGEDPPVAAVRRRRRW